MTVVTAKKAAKRIKEMEATRQKIRRDPELAKSLLIKAGIYDKDLKLTKPYR